MTASLNKSRVSTVAFVLVLALAATFVACLPAVIAEAVEPVTAVLWVTINLAAIVQLLANGFFSSVEVRLAQPLRF